MGVEIKLNPNLNLGLLQEKFSKARRVQIPNILKGTSADYIHSVLKNDVAWELVFNIDETPHYKTQDDLRKMNSAQIQEMREYILKKAQTSFQFMYSTYNIYAKIKKGENPGHPIHAFHDFVNSQSFFDVISEITGEDKFTFADSQATAYGPGHFLTLHSDKAPGETRVFAYVFNFTRNWDLDWGGSLQFLGNDGNLDCAFVPAFNVLNLFEIPQTHAVSYVTPFARGSRLAITGWLRENDKGI